MISVVLTDKPVTWQYEQYKTAGRTGTFPWTVYAARGKDSLAPPVRTVVLRDTGSIQDLGVYGDKSQTCHAVLHRDVDGVICPSGMAVQGGHNVLTPGTNEILLYATGSYEFENVVPGPSDWSSRDLQSRVHCEFVNSSSGIACAWYYVIVYNYGCSDAHVGGVYLRWWSYDFDSRNHYRRRSSGNTWIPETFADAAENLKFYSHKAVMKLLEIRPDGNVGSSTSVPGFNRKCTLPAFSPPVGSLAHGARTLRDLIPRYPLPENLEKELYAECVEGQNCFTSNGIAFASDIGKVGDSIRALLALVENPTSAKQWASTWLAMRFTDRLTYQDSKELLEGIRGELGRLAVALSYKETHSVRSYAYSPLHSTFVDSYAIVARARLRCENASYSDLMSAVKKMMEWDVWPSLENMWDMIPLSFVVDWFTNLSTILTNVDRLVYEQYLRVRIYERSDKLRVAFTPAALAYAFGTSPDSFNGSVTGRLYHRRSAERPQLGILDGWDPSLPAPKNFVDSAALLVQMR
jgi:hypothetical protein